MDIQDIEVGGLVHVNKERSAHHKKKVKYYQFTQIMD